MIDPDVLTDAELRRVVKRELFRRDAREALMRGELQSTVEALVITTAALGGEFDKQQAFEVGVAVLSNVKTMPLEGRTYTDMIDALPVYELKKGDAYE